MITLTQSQLDSAIAAMRDAIRQDLDAYSNRIISQMGINPIDLADDQILAIINGVFDDDFA